MKPTCKCSACRMRRRRWWPRPIPLLLLASCALMAGCVTKPVVKPAPCAGWAAIYPSRADVLTDGTAKQILAHDRHGEAIGCWKAGQP